MRRLLLTLLLLAFAGSARADSVKLTLVHEGPGYAGGPNTAGGVYVYPYYFSIDDSSDLVALLCNDFDHDVANGESWLANVHTLSDILGGAGQLNASSGSGLTRDQAYTAAAWLYLQLGDPPFAHQAAAINFAIWGLFSDNGLGASAYGNTYPDTDSAAMWTQTALDAIGSSSFSPNELSGVRFYTPIPGTQPDNLGLPQEYIGVAPVPEPGSLLLLGTGLAGLARLRKRKARK